MQLEMREKPSWGGLDLLRRFGMLLVLILLIVVMAVLSDRFLTVSNFLNILRQVSVNAIVAAGMTVVILAGGIDLSVGSVLALAGAVSAGVLAGTSNPWLAILAGLAIGTLMGVVNGVFVAYPRLAPFIVTLATMALARGLTLVYTGGRPILVMSPAYEFIGGGQVLGIPVPVLLVTLTYAVGWVVLTHTKFGRYVYAIGGNENTCRLSGINVEGIKVAIYGISGLLAGLTGVVLTSRLFSAQPTAGTGYELDAIAAVILGGTSLTGGEGSILGTVVGAIIMGVLANGMNILNVSPFYQDVAKGVVILLAVLLDWLIHRAGPSERAAV